MIPGMTRAMKRQINNPETKRKQLQDILERELKKGKAKEEKEE